MFSDDYSDASPPGDGWIGRGSLSCLICKNCTNKVITVLGQLRNICSALCTAGSPWEQGAASDKKSQEILKTTESDAAFLSNILAGSPGSRDCLQHPSTPTQTTLLWHWSLQNSYPIALMSRFGTISKNFGLLRIWNKIQILKYVQKQAGSDQELLQSTPWCTRIPSPACRSGYATSERIWQKQKIHRERKQGLSEEWKDSHRWQIDMDWD